MPTDICISISPLLQYDNCSKDPFSALEMQGLLFRISLFIAEVTEIVLAAASSILQDSNTTALENPLFPLIDSLVAKNVFDFNWRKRQRNFTSVFVKLNSTFRVLRLTAMVSDLKQLKDVLMDFCRF